VNNHIFTLSEANALLPQLKQDLLELQTLTGQFEEQYLDLQKQKKFHIHKEGVQDPFFETEVQLEFMRLEAEVLMENFARKGVLLKMVNPGLLDFPAVLDGKDVLICWKEGEERISHYHGWDEGFIGRKPLPEA
jgi:hypothetical protein